MEIKAFVDAYQSKKFINTKTGVDERIEWIKKELEIKEYISFDEKQAVAKTVLENCASIRDGVIVIDSIQKYLLFTMAMLSTYTNLDSEDGESLSEAYDMLCSVKVDDGTLLDAIIKTFEIEYARCNDILNMMTADLLADNNIENQIGKLLTVISNKIDKFGDNLIDKIGNFGEDLDQLDIDKLIDVIEKIK
jgi:hypothetical protein